MSVHYEFHMHWCNGVTINTVHSVLIHPMLHQAQRVTWKFHIINKPNYSKQQWQV